jgi:hypothetical protein
MNLVINALRLNVQLRLRASQKRATSSTVQQQMLEIIGWGGRIRTSAWRNQNPLPYHLATPHQGRLTSRTATACCTRLGRCVPSRQGGGKRYERRDHTCAVGHDQRLLRRFIRTAHQRSEVDGLSAHRSRVKPKRGWQSLRRSLATRFSMRPNRPPHHLRLWQTGHIQDTRRG